MPKKEKCRLLQREKLEFSRKLLAELSNSLAYFKAEIHLNNGFRFHDFSSHLDDIFDFRFDVGQRVDDARCVVQLTLDPLLLVGRQLR